LEKICKFFEYQKIGKNNFKKHTLLPTLSHLLQSVFFYVKFCLSGEYLFENGNKKKNCFSGFLVARFQGGKKENKKTKNPLKISRFLY